MNNISKFLSRLESILSRLYTECYLLLGMHTGLINEMIMLAIVTIVIISPWDVMTHHKPPMSLG